MPENTMATTQITLSKPGTLWLSVKANNGSVTVERQVGADWIASDKFAVDGSWPLNLGPVRTRFTPAGGAAYQLTDSAGNNIEVSK
jgi:hypothetical protein